MKKKKHDKVNLLFIECLQFTNQNSINKIKPEIRVKINLNSYYVKCDFKKFANTDEEGLGNLFKNLNYV